MIKIDSDGYNLCDIQADLFEQSITKLECSSEIFVRRFMNSKVAEELDSKYFLDGTKSIKDIFDSLDNEYGKTDYGKVKYDKEIMYWMGYLYRYFSYTYNLSSKQVYKIIKPKELGGLYYPYHTLDVANAISRILEQKDISFEKEDINEKALQIYKNIRYQERLVNHLNDDFDVLNDPNRAMCLSDIESDEEKHFIKINEKLYEVTIIDGKENYKKYKIIAIINSKELKELLVLVGSKNKKYSDEEIRNYLNCLDIKHYKIIK